MKTPRTLHLNPATAIASVALFFSLGGGAGAAALHFINGASITPHSITLRQLSPQAIAALKGSSGAAGSQGSQGPQGPAGSQGAAGATGQAGADALAAPATGSQEVIETTSITLQPNSGGGSSTECPSGYVATGGGGGAGLGTGGPWNGVSFFYFSGSTPEISRTTHKAIGWDTDAVNTLPVAYTYIQYAVCIPEG
jgi:hypothetical protein